MNMLRTSLLPCLLLLGQQYAAGLEPPLKTDFAQNPVAVGWELRASGDQPFDGGWIETGGTPGQRCLVVAAATGRRRRSASGRFITTASTSPPRRKKAASGRPYSSMPTARNWSPTFTTASTARWTGSRRRFVFGDMPRPGTSASAFTPTAGRLGKAAALEEVDSAAVAEWADGIAARNPALYYTPPQKSCARLPKTMKTLQQGGKLRIVMLGDSICNDTANSLYETLLKRAYPRAEIEVVASVRGGGSCQYYKDENRVQEYVLRFQPDLVIIAGISHGYDPEAIRSVIRQIKGQAECEIMVLTGALTPDETCKEGYFKSSTLTVSQGPGEFREVHRPHAAHDGRGTRGVPRYAGGMERVCLRSPRPIEWFLRDPIHPRHPRLREDPGERFPRDHDLDQADPQRRGSGRAQDQGLARQDPDRHVPILGRLARPYRAERALHVAANARRRRAGEPAAPHRAGEVLRGPKVRLALAPHLVGLLEFRQPRRREQNSRPTFRRSSRAS